MLWLRGIACRGRGWGDGSQGFEIGVGAGRVWRIWGIWAVVAGAGESALTNSIWAGRQEQERERERDVDAGCAEVMEPVHSPQLSEEAARKTQIRRSQQDLRYQYRNRWA